MVCHLSSTTPQKLLFGVIVLHSYLSSNSPLLAARDEFEFGRIQLHRRVSRVDVIPCSLSHDLEALDRLQGEFIQTIRLAQAQIVTYLANGFFSFGLTGSVHSHSYRAKCQNQELELPETNPKRVSSVKFSSYYRNSHPKSTPCMRKGCHRPAEAGKARTD